jgi:acetyltransferase-like isoleucine patch superfamily enzyme
MAIIDHEKNVILTKNGLGFYVLNRVLADDFCFEPPCSIKMANVEQACSLGAFSYIVSGYLCGVEIGRYCSFGEDVQIGRQNHPLSWLSTSPFLYLDNSQILDATAHQFSDVTMHEAAFLSEPATILRKTVIKNDVWVGQSAIINAGVTIENGAIIAAGSVVTRNVPAYAIVGGNPATIIRYRFPPHIIARLEDIQWWRFSPQQIKGITINNIQQAIIEFERLNQIATEYIPQRKIIAEFFTYN